MMSEKEPKKLFGLNYLLDEKMPRDIIGVMDNKVIYAIDIREGIDRARLFSQRLNLKTFRFNADIDGYLMQNLTDRKENDG